MNLLALPQGTTLCLGPEARVQVTGLRTPCVKMDRYRQGMQALLWGPSTAKGKRERRAGVMAVVERGGTVRAGNAVLVVLPSRPYLPLGPV